MTESERRKKVIALIKAHTRKTVETRESARAWLISTGIYNESGELTPEFGGAEKDKKKEPA